MINLPTDILNIIFQYGGYKTMFIDKYLYKKISTIRNDFRENPLKINYKLIQWKRKITYYDDSVITGRPSFMKREKQLFYLSGKIPINIINKRGIITPSIKLKDELIPLSYTKETGNCDCEISKTIYWTIDIINTENINKAKLYKLVWT